MAQGVQPQVVVGIDGSDESIDALEWAASYAERCGGELIAVVAWHLPTSYATVLSGDELELGAHQTADSAIETVRSTHPSLNVQTRVMKGSPGKMLVEASENADLLVVGTRSALGSVSSYCAHYASGPMAIVRKGSRSV